MAVNPPPSGNQLSYAQLEALWIEAGGPKALAPLMAAIAMAESGGRVDAMNPTDNNGTQTSVGLWQVSTGTHQYPADWASALGNAQEAVVKYHSQGLGAWGTYTSGAYKQFFNGKIPPSANVRAGAPGGSGGALGGFFDQVLNALNFSFWSQGVPDVKASTSDIAQSISSVALPLVKFAEALDWFFHPAHWIRLFAGIGGGILVLFGIWQMSHAGEGAAF